PRGPPRLPYTTLFRSEPLRAVQLHGGAALAAAGLGCGDVRRAVGDDAAAACGAVERARFAAHAQADGGVATAAGLAAERVRLLRSEEHTSELQSRENL